MVLLTPEQQAAAYASGSVVVTAGAGTGKTSMLTERYLYYLREKQLSPLNIVAITFTEKAALELRSRISSRILEEFPERIDILAELQVAQISTIHALAGRICREYPQQANIPADFQILDELTGTLWLSNALETALKQLSPEIYQSIPYSILLDILEPLLADPLTAESAFEQQLNWQDLAKTLRKTALTELLNDASFQNSKLILTQYQGKPNDKLETIRQHTILAIQDLEQQQNIVQSLQILEEIKLNVGSKANWEPGILETVKEALKQLRELTRTSRKQGLITLEWSQADQQLAKLLPILKQAYQKVSEILSQIKHQSRVLSFSDLEVCALRVLQNPEIQRDYQQNWIVFLVDEFQDTNPIQGQLIERLTTTAELTIVGDQQQSIYGFRRADIRVFDQFRDRILKQNGTEVILRESFRTHSVLIDHLNQIFAPLLNELHQPLTSSRSPTSSQPALQAFTVQKNSETTKLQRQRVEANYIAETLQKLLTSETLIYDKKINQLRGLEPGDIAILTRTWEPLELYGDALMAVNIPVAPAKGGNLLNTREAKDARALLQFLADTRDDIALIAVLRSPFFAVSDRLLFQLGMTRPSVTLESANDEPPTQQLMNWWPYLNTLNLPELTHPLQVLKQLLSKRNQDVPSRLLQWADHLTGYTAVISHLPNSARREADWQGFREVVKQLEAGTQDLFAVVRRLKQLVEKNVAVPRDSLETGNAVSLMTIHAAKGLEWPVVVVADLSRQRPSISPKVAFDPDYGVTFNLNGGSEPPQKPILSILLEQLRKQREAEEALRVLYVALTRARDRLILTATEDQGQDWEHLGLQLADLPIEPIVFEPEKALPPIPLTSQPSEDTRPVLIQSLGSGLFQLPVTALTVYAQCPKQFQFRFIEGHPGFREGLTTAMQVGTLVHRALEHQIRQIDDLKSFADFPWTTDVLEEAVGLVQRFDQVPQFVELQKNALTKEQSITLMEGKLTLNGVVDLVGHSWVLDYKTDQHINPQHHRFQLWAYAKALGYSEAYIAYLRQDYLHHFNSEELTTTDQEAQTLIQELLAGNYSSSPSKSVCSGCSYSNFCEDADID